MVVNEKANKIYKFFELHFVRTIFVEVIFVGTVFVSSIIPSYVITESPIKLSEYLPFLQLHEAEFQI